MSACPVDRDVLCTIMSMLMPGFATARKIFAATPILSGMPDTVIVASLLSWATPVMIGWSMRLSSDSPAAATAELVTQVPSLLLNDDRTWIGIWKCLAYSTQRRYSTLAPQAAISSISS